MWLGQQPLCRREKLLLLLSWEIENIKKNKKKNSKKKKRNKKWKDIVYTQQQEIYQDNETESESFIEA